MSLLRSLFSFRGRTARLFYWVFYPIHAGIYGTAALTFYGLTGIWYVRDATAYDDFIIPAFVLGTAILSIPAAAVMTRRLHDRGRSGWWLALGVALAFLAVATVLKYAPSFNYYTVQKKDFVESVTALTTTGMLGFVPWSAAVLVFSRGDVAWNYIVPALLGVGPLLIFGLWFLVDVALRRGNPDANAYGPAPTRWLGSDGPASSEAVAGKLLPISGAALAAIAGVVLLTGILESHTMPCDMAQTITPATASTAREFEDCFEVKGTRVCGPRMVVVPTGSFQMGSKIPNEEPVHTVAFARPFALGKFEVSVAQWEACVTDGGCRATRPEGWQPRGRDVTGSRCRKPVGPDWNMITTEYLPWLTRMTGKPYRLASESEWEYAARAGTTTKFPTGDQLSSDYEHYNGNRAEGVMTIDVGSRKPNPFGLHDMLGNAEEWVADIYNWNYKGAPANGSAWTQPTHDQAIVGEMRVIRGGSWAKKPEAISPTMREGRWRHQAASFRVALSDPDAAEEEGCFKGNIDACKRVIDGPTASSLSGARLANAYKSRGYELLKLQRFDEALADFQSALKTSGDAFLNIHIGKTHLAKKDYQKALDAFDALKAPGFVDAQVLGRASALEGLGRKDEAIAEYERFEKAFSESGTVGAGQRQTANDALIRLGARKAPDPASTKPAASQEACAAERREMDELNAKAAATTGGDQAAACALIRPMATASYKYCLCSNGTPQSRLESCLDETGKPIRELKKKFSCP